MTISNSKLIISRRKRRAWLLKHHRTDIDRFGKVLWFTGKDLWQRIKKARHRYIIDTHTGWEGYLGQREYDADVFIIGTTRLNEQDELLRLFEDPKGKKKCGKNFFLFGFANGEGKIQRLDELALSTYDPKKLKESPFYEPQAAEKAHEEDLLRDAIRTQLVQILKRGQAGRNRREIKIQDQWLYQMIQTNRETAFADLEISADTARLAFALLLINSSKARSNYAKKGSFNGFLDAALIGNALFFNAHILSTDGGVEEMGRYCGIKVRPDLGQ